MQRILIGVDTTVRFTKYLAQLLIGELGEDEEYWFEYVLKRNKEFRTDYKVQDAIKRNNFIVDEDYYTKHRTKTVEIPDDIDWEVGDYAHEYGEYVYEKYRVWS